MPSYVITGVSKGLGWEFLTQLSSDPNNIVIGIVRNKPATDKRVAEELAGRRNITILAADLTNYNSLKTAASDAGAVTGGKLDYLIANAGSVSQYDAYDDIGTLGTQDPEKFTKQFHEILDTNVVGQVHLYNLFMPQILAGDVKKVILISSGMGDIEITKDLDLAVAPIYATSKAAANMITAKFSAQYKKDGVLFLSICPGMVEVGHFNQMSPEQAEKLPEMIAKFQRYNPHFKGPITPPESIKAVLSLVERSSVENGDGGDYMSHFGTRRWI
ncbi:hypothetical protein BDV96DRAFT_568960 [Lophiotrema nucula]|uniref:Short chain dehydrogenase n=1 Tax=Lophiotrema nucula TaxID=690887 RepID=A0A6A5ZLE0_9PLEO|nr:hypothetical protein BDV96DRAFT_568960 [Lophiotrema nucula]